jgi:hypothetical protein
LHLKAETPKRAPALIWLDLLFKQQEVQLVSLAYWKPLSLIVKTVLNAIGSPPLFDHTSGIQGSRHRPYGKVAIRPKPSDGFIVATKTPEKRQLRSVKTYD